MRYIIEIDASESGSRPPLQEWNDDYQPDGYAYCDEEQYAVFYSTVPAGFVNITIKDEDDYKVVDTIEVNQELVDKWNEEHPIPDPGDEEISDKEAVNIITGNISDAEALNIITGGNE